ncbi:hypothetical protein RRG08_048728 [Elysia crispata]|uniref:NADPH oxidase n=1 Tax=Elysia crispata TaxID=231223 RepID=A0AAE1B6V8_9GAST|nr:hypothetical protein RRG08_048728 [Elysia crispata]
MSGNPSLSAVLRNRRMRGEGLWDEWHPFTISSAPEQEAALRNRRVRGMKGGGGGGLWDEWHPFTISSAPEQEGEGGGLWDEWHPFTISSAPEQEDTFWVHIRSAGHWTKNLREHLLTHYSPKKTSASSVSSQFKRRASSIAWFARRTSMARAKDASIRRRTITKDVNLQIFVDGPYGSPCREIFETEHAILIGSGIGVTPFASILQSITYRFKAGLVTCPKCMYSWCHAPRNLMNLKKVDFVWINRDQSNFEWFSSLICNLEKEQSKEASLKDAISMHMFMTAAPNQYEVNGVGVQMALDLVHHVKKTDLLTGLATRTQGGRPDFDKLFRDIKAKSTHNRIKVFFCGSPLLGKKIQQACLQHGILFSKEHF